ncbi:MAG: DUF6506 family protein [Clostridiales bacterium]
MKKKFAYLLMGSHFDPEIHQAHFETEFQISSIFTVTGLKAACDKAVELKNQGYGAIELCGAFGAENAQKIIDLTKNEVVIGYVCNNPQQGDLAGKFFGNFGKSE